MLSQINDRKHPAGGATEPGLQACLFLFLFHYIRQKAMTKKCFPLLLLLFLAFHQDAMAQRSAIHDEPDATYRQAKELFHKEKYGAARQLFLLTIERINDPKDVLQADATLYSAICAAELFNPDAETLLLSFLEDHPAHHGQKQARFHMGNIKYRQRDYDEAVTWYARLVPRDIDRDRRDEFVFKKGYSHFMTESLATARQLFGQITDATSSYYGPATYYHGHVAYLTGDYDAAMRSFQQLTDDRHFGPVVPYYIVHIYYLQGRYDALLEHAPALLEESTPRRAAEIARLIGEAHFQQSQYAEAIPYLEQFIHHGRGAAGREDHYQLGFALYMTGRMEEAIPQLERAITEADEMTQNAYFHLASAYIKTGQKRFARNAFMQAHQIGIIEDIARESLFNYALLSFELSYDPHNEAILSFQKYVSEYPASPRTEEALGYLADLYLTTRNYKDALTSLEQVSLDTPRLREAYQRVTFFRGVELFNNGAFRDAIAHFEKAQQYTENREILASSIYWMGEAHYRQGQYDEAISRHETFLVTPGASSLDLYPQANYSIGYAYFKKEQYSNAIPAFRKYVAAPGEDPRMVNDAVLRIADAYFITKQYHQAMDFYNRAINLDVIDTDYAVFQKGLVYGITGNFIRKISTMESLITDYPRSSFIDDGKYEIANTWLILDNNTRAKDFFYQVIDQHPNSSYAQSAMLKTGLIYYNENEDMKALDMFKTVVEQYPGTTQAEEALASIRTIYVGLDRVEEFVRFTEEIGIADITTAQEDSLVYQAAEQRYMQGDCAQAIQSFNNYLDRFPGGIFAVNAQYYRSECLFRTNEQQRALEGYQFVIDRPRSKFLENALLRASGIEYNQGNYEEALPYYHQLEEVAEVRNNLLVARKGTMRCLVHMERHQEAMEAANAVLNTDKLSQEEEQEALLVRGLSALSVQQTAVARESLQQVVEIAENRRAAEAMYNLALITFRQGNYEEAEEQIFEYINKLSAYDHWLAKTFLLLADLYIETDNTFQAKHTLESIIENVEDDDLRIKAENKLEFILEQERMMERRQEKDTIEIELGERE